MHNKNRKRWFHIFYGFLSKWILKIIGITCRFQVEGLKDFLEIAKKEKCILMLWHYRLVMMTEALTRFTPQLRYAALISDSRDGEILCFLADHCGIGRSIRVPHNARSAALQTLIKEIKNTSDIVIITPDGPRGPAHRVKPGIVLAAKKTGAKIIPLTWSASRFWQLPTWDGLIIPKPFSKISVKFGSSIVIEEKEADGAVKLEHALESIEKKYQ